MHLYVLPACHARLYGQYRYEGRSKAIGLTGQRRANGEVLLREYTTEASQRPTAEFRLALQADGSLAGTWQTLPPARPRHFAATWRPESLPAPNCQLPTSTGQNTDVPVILVADTSVDQKLRHQLKGMLTSDEGDPGTMSWLVDYANNCLLSLHVASEVTGASVTQGNQRYLVDLRTGPSP